MVCGRSPFEGASPLDTIYNVLHTDPPPASSFRADVPPALDACIATLLRKDPASRYRSAHEVMEALRRDLPAVLPFTSHGVASDDYFGEGLAEELITCLARLEGVRVMSRTSAFELKQDEEVADAGRRLGVRCVLHGTARRTGQRIRISARLLEVATGAHLWAEQYERDLRDIFDVQEDIAACITHALHWQLQRYAGRPLVRRYTDNPEVYNKYLEGRYWMHRETMEGFERGRELLESVLRDEPRLRPL